MACAAICSLVKEGEIKPSASRIKIVRREWSGLYLQVVCQQCDPPACRIACPKNAISRDMGTGAMLVDPQKCDLCGACVRACPFGAIHLGENSAIVCDLCGGEPKCIEWCPHAALKFSPLGTSERRKIMDDLLGLKKAAGYKPRLSVK